MDASVKGDDCWQDITQDFLSAARQLDLGELLKTTSFTLFDAMGALELMDPKIDGGMLLKKANKKILNLEQSIEADLVKVDNLTAEEIIGIIDETYSCLVSWFEGNFLAQTVMINMYLQDTELIKDRCLKIFSQSMLKIVDFINKLVQMNYCIEEEDFQLNGGIFNLGHQLSDQKVMNNLEELCQHYEKILRGEKQTSITSNAKKQVHQQDTEPVSQVFGSEHQYDKKYQTAILNRLRFTYHLYGCLYNISKNLLTTYWNLNQVVDNQLQKTTKLVQQHLQACDKHLEKSNTYLENWCESIDFGIKPEPSSCESDDCDLGGPVIMGFDRFLNNRLVSPAFPRYPAMKSRLESVKSMESMVKKLQKCISLSFSFSHSSFDKSLESFEEFSKYFEPKSCVISRSFLQTLYLPNRSDKLMRDELLQSLTDYCEPVIQAMRKDESRAKKIDEFLIKCVNPFWQVINLYGHNSARQHDRFPSLISAFKDLQYSAYEINDMFNDKMDIIYSWTTCFLAKLCIKFIHAGLELELFSTHEYPYVYWYLHDILYWNEREQLEHAKRYILESLQKPDEAQKKAKIKKQRKKEQNSTMYHDKYLLCNDGYRYLTGGLSLLTHGLKLQGKIKSPAGNLTTEKVCFDHRFGNITSTSVFESFKNTLKKLEKLEYIYREALECFKEAKNLFELIGEHEDCVKICKSNMVVTKILSSNPESFVDRNAEFSFEIHPSYPTVKF